MDSAPTGARTRKPVVVVIHPLTVWSPQACGLQGQSCSFQNLVSHRQCVCVCVYFCFSSHWTYVLETPIKGELNIPKTFRTTCSMTPPTPTGNDSLIQDKMECRVLSSVARGTELYPPDSRFTLSQESLCSYLPIGKMVHFVNAVLCFISEVVTCPWTKKLGSIDKETWKSREEAEIRGASQGWIRHIHGPVSEKDCGACHPSMAL